MIKSLPKSFEMKYEKLPFYYNDIWITNGKFAIKRDNVKESYKYCLSKPDFEQPDINRVIPMQLGSIRVTKTNRLYDMAGGDYGRVFIDQNNVEYVINEVYVKHFSLDVLYTHGEYEVMSNEDLSFIIMPMNNSYVEKRKAA